MKAVVLILSVILAVIGLTANALFYSTMAIGGLFVFIYVSLGLTFDLFKLSLLPLAGSIKKRGHILAGGVAAGFFMALTAISLLAILGFQLISQTEVQATNRKVSDTYQAATSAHEAAIARVDSLSGYADGSAATRAEQEKTRLEDKLAAFLAGTAINRNGANIGTVAYAINLYGCNGFYSSLCTKQTRIKHAISEQRRTITLHSEYLSAKQYEAERAGQRATLSNNSTGGYAHPLFLGLAAATGMQVNTAIITVLGATGAVAEFLASFGFYVVFHILGGIGTRKEYALSEIREVLQYVDAEPLLVVGGNTAAALERQPAPEEFALKKI